ncbi:hypothetical protein SAMN04487981_10724 [Streptomyces sp. cf386]|nr:hypothetical protein SAMN04487981_10724 [Streptomyces sp. cf386]
MAGVSAGSARLIELRDGLREPRAFRLPGGPGDPQHALPEQIAGLLQPYRLAALVEEARGRGEELQPAACFIALGGVFEGSGGAPVLLRVTLLGTAVQLPLAFGLSGLGLPGACLALALAMAAQCAAVPVLLRRVRRQEGGDVSLVRVA